MHGTDATRRALFSYADLDERIPPRHPMGKIRQVLHDATASLNAEFVKTSSGSTARALAVQTMAYSVLPRAARQLTMGYHSGLAGHRAFRGSGYDGLAGARLSLRAFYHIDGARLRGQDGWWHYPLTAPDTRPPTILRWLNNTRTKSGTITETVAATEYIT